MNKDKSWIKIKYWIPFRNYYMYWDKRNNDDYYYGDTEFINRKVRVKFKKFEYKHNEKPYIAVFVTCWQWDAKKVEEALDNLNEKLKIIDNKYSSFIEEWKETIKNGF